MRQAYVSLRAVTHVFAMWHLSPGVGPRRPGPRVGAMTDVAAGQAPCGSPPSPTSRWPGRRSAGCPIYTPMEESRWLSGTAGGPVLIKAENLQRTGSFKIRGAYLRMSPALRRRRSAAGVVAASAGNHAQGVALAAQMLGIHATVFMPEGAPIPKEKATRGYGAEVRFHGHSVDEALVAAKQFAAETGAVLIHPFDHIDIVTGQGTCGLEILEQCPDVRTVIVSARRRRVPGRHRDRGQGAASRRARRRRAGRGRRGVPRLAARRAARSPLGDDVHDGRRHRGRLPRRGAVRRDPEVRRRVRSRSARSRCPGRC